jgi:hypothetical protein
MPTKENQFPRAERWRTIGTKTTRTGFMMEYEPSHLGLGRIGFQDVCGRSQSPDNKTSQHTSTIIGSDRPRKLRHSRGTGGTPAPMQHSRYKRLAEKPDEKEHSILARTIAAQLESSSSVLDDLSQVEVTPSRISLLIVHLLIRYPLAGSTTTKKRIYLDRDSDCRFCRARVRDVERRFGSAVRNT